MLGQHRSTQRHVPRGRAGEERLVADMIELARQYGRYGYRRIAALLREAGWSVSDGRVERLWRREGLKVPQKQPKKGRLWLNDGSCVERQPSSGQITALSSWLKLSRTGLKPSALRQPTSNRDRSSRDIAMRCPAGQCVGERIL